LRLQRKNLISLILQGRISRNGRIDGLLYLCKLSRLPGRRTETTLERGELAIDRACRLLDALRRNRNAVFLPASVLIFSDMMLACMVPRTMMVLASRGEISCRVSRAQHSSSVHVMTG
jgi:hypothetical protein